MCSERAARRCWACRAGSRCPPAPRKSRPRFSITPPPTCRPCKTAVLLRASSPVAMVSPWFYTEVTAQQGASVPLDPDHEERAIYLVDGEVEIAGDRYEGPRLLIFRPGDRITVKATKPVRMMFLGGDALEGPRHIWWNFVSSSKERIEQAKADWKSGRFAHVPNETEFIPLPE